MNVVFFSLELFIFEISLLRECRKLSWISLASVLGIRTLRQEKVGDCNEDRGIAE